LFTHSYLEQRVRSDDFVVSVQGNKKRKQQTLVALTGIEPVFQP
jgi:hypothetical protein